MHTRQRFGARVAIAIGMTLGAISVVTGAAGCGASSDAQLAVDSAPTAAAPPVALPTYGGVFIPGEVMRFELSLRGITGGEAAIGVGEPGVIDGKPTIIVRSRVESAGVVAVFKEVRDEVTTWIDVETGLPRALHAEVKFGSKEAIIETGFAGGESGAFRIAVTRLGRNARTRSYHQAMPKGLAAFDSHSAVGAMRAWRGEVGQRAYFYALVGRRLWKSTVRITGRETLRTKLGRTDVVRLDGIAERVTSQLRPSKGKAPRYYTLYLSDDDRRLPVLVTAKTEYGDIRVELIDYHAPSQLRARNDLK